MRDLSVTLDGSGLRIGIVASRFNDAIVSQMLDGTQARLLALGVADEDISLAWVAGAFEIPMAARAMAMSGFPAFRAATAEEYSASSVPVSIFS